MAIWPRSEARPKDFFDTQLTPEFLSWVIEVTNLCAYSSGAGSGEYKDSLPFDLNELNKMVGVLFLNGLSPKPQVESWFKPLSEQPLFGNDLFSTKLAKRNYATKTMVGGAATLEAFPLLSYVLQLPQESKREAEGGPDVEDLPSS